MFIFYLFTGKIVNSDNTLTLSGKKDENGASENQPRVTYTKVTIYNVKRTKNTFFPRQ